MTKAKFIAFEKVRKSGLTNMYDINKVRLIAVAKYGQILTKKDCFGGKGKGVRYIQGNVI